MARDKVGMIPLFNQIKNILSQLTVDYIVEEGEEVNNNCRWKYRKWNSGYAEMWGSFPDTGTYTTSMDEWTSSLYYNDILIDNGRKFPFSFISVPNVIVQTQDTNMQVSVWGTERVTKDYVGNVRLVQPNSNSNAYHLIFYVFGKWK